MSCYMSCYGLHGFPTCPAALSMTCRLRNSFCGEAVLRRACLDIHCLGRMEYHKLISRLLSFLCPLAFKISDLSCWSSKPYLIVSCAPWRWSRQHCGWQRRRASNKLHSFWKLQCVQSLQIQPSTYSFWPWFDMMAALFRYGFICSADNLAEVHVNNLCDLTQVLFVL